MSLIVFVANFDHIFALEWKGFFSASSAPLRELLNWVFWKQRFRQTIDHAGDELKNKSKNGSRRDAESAELFRMLGKLSRVYLFHANAGGLARGLAEWFQRRNGLKVNVLILDGRSLLGSRRPRERNPQCSILPDPE